MKLPTKELREALGRLKPIFKGKSSMPCLSCVQIHAANNIIWLLASNLDEWICENIVCQGEMPLFLINYEKLCASLGVAEEIEFSFSKTHLTINGGGDERKVGIHFEHPFPAMPDLNIPAQAMSLSDLREGIESVHGFEHKDANARPNICSLHIRGYSKRLECHAADGMNAAFFQRHLICSEFECLIPSRSVPLLLSALERDEAQFHVGQKGVHVTHSEGWFYCCQPDIKFCDTTEWTRAKLVKLVEIDRKAMIASLESLLPFFNPANVPRLDIEVTPNAIDCYFNTETDQIHFSISGEFKLLGKHSVSAEAMLKCLRQIKSGEAQILHDDHCFVYRSGDLTLISMNLRPQ